MTFLSQWLGKDAPQGRSGEFVLIYEPSGEPRVTVGHLAYDGHEWTFSYDEDYKRHRPELRPIEGFSELNKVYRSSVLFPFFRVRIPDVRRPDVEGLLKEKRVRNPGQAELLRIFGKHAAASPSFKLEAATP
ncbi:MAG: hypothetical protein J4F30_07610 [Acidobacteria bacterium]|nr:hypothetical protein [Acidobacteriota bacterium]